MSNTVIDAEAVRERDDELYVLDIRPTYSYEEAHIPGSHSLPIYDQLKGPWRKGANIVITTGSAVVMFYLAYYAVIYEMQVRSIGQATPSLGIPIWILYLLVPIGLFLAGLQYLLTTVRNLTSKEVYRSFMELEVYEEADLNAAESSEQRDDSSIDPSKEAR